MAERPKTAGLLQVVFAADGDMAQVVIWERRKREKAWLKAIVRRKIRLCLRHPPDN